MTQARHEYSAQLMLLKDMPGTDPFKIGVPKYRKFEPTV